jgi:catechol 2,3-dioxygenase-like lactoylglutathione lyase family enzyme
MIEQIQTVAVMVSDEKKAKEWYRDKLEFEVQSDEEHWIVVAPRASSSSLHLCPDEALEPGNTGILMLAGDIENTCKELKRKGVQFTRELGKAEWDETTTYAMFKDPDGNVFWLMPKQQGQ